MAEERLRKWAVPAAAIEGDTLVIAQTRNEEHASEGQYGQLVTVIHLSDAIAIAKAILASRAQELHDEEAKYEAWLEVQYQRHLDHQALVDSALEHEVAF